MKLASAFVTFLTATLFTLGAVAAEMRLAVTTSFHNSGLSDILLPQIKKDIDLDVQLVVVGTGQALKLGRAGDVDAILVHSKKAEEAFVAEGYGTHRREIMYNDFVLIGPSDDPAKIATVKYIWDAMTLFALTKPAFVSRGDDSGTHRFFTHGRRESTHHFQCHIGFDQGTTNFPKCGGDVFFRQRATPGQAVKYAAEAI